MGRVRSVTETDQDAITNGVFRVTNGKGNCRVKGLLESGEVRAHSNYECFGFFSEHGRRWRQKVRIGDRGRMETIGEVNDVPRMLRLLIANSAIGSIVGQSALAAQRIRSCCETRALTRSTAPLARGWKATVGVSLMPSAAHMSIQ